MTEHKHTDTLAKQTKTSFYNRTKYAIGKFAEDIQRTKSEQIQISLFFSCES